MRTANGRLKIARWFKSQRSQSMTEFALIAPILLLFIFVIVDFGRGIYYYVTMQQAVQEGARAAVRHSNPLPSDSTVENTVAQHAIATFLANPCRNGPVFVAGQIPPANEGWIFITQPQTTTEHLTNQEMAPNVAPNAPGGEPRNDTPGGGCSSINPAAGNAGLQVTIRYNFVPLTPIVQQFTANSIILTAFCVYRTEY